MTKKTILLLTFILVQSCTILPSHNISTQPDNDKIISQSSKIDFKALDNIQKNFNQKFPNIDSTNFDSLTVYKYINSPIEERDETKFHELTDKEQRYVSLYKQKEQRTHTLQHYTVECPCHCLPDYDYLQIDLGQTVDQIIDMQSRQERKQRLCEQIASLQKSITKNYKDRNDNLAENFYNYTRYKDNYVTLLTQNAEYEHALSLLSHVQECDAAITLQCLARTYIAKNYMTKVRNAHKESEQLQRQRAAKDKKQAKKLKNQQEQQAAKLIAEQQAAAKLRELEEQQAIQRTEKLIKEQQAAEKLRELEEQRKNMRRKAQELQSARDKAKFQNESEKESKKQGICNFSDADLELFTSDIPTTPNNSELKPSSIQQTNNASTDVCSCSELEKYNAWVNGHSKRKEAIEIQKETIRKNVRTKHLNLFFKNKSRGQQYKPDKDAIEADCDKEFKKNWPDDLVNDTEVINVLAIYSQNLQNLQKCERESSFVSFNNILARMTNQIEPKLNKNGECIAWYLASHPELYEGIKAQYLKLQKEVDLMDREEIKKTISTLLATLKNPSISENEKKGDKYLITKMQAQSLIIDIANKIKTLHNINGILDISHLIYPQPSAEIFDATIKLSQYDLQQAENQIKEILLPIKNQSKLLLSMFQCDSKEKIAQVTKEYWISNPYYYTAMQPIITNLLDTAAVDLNQDEIIDFIKKPIEIALHDKSITMTPNLFMNIKQSIFLSLQRENELAIKSLTHDQIIDLTKVLACMTKTIIDVIQKP